MPIGPSFRPLGTTLEFFPSRNFPSKCKTGPSEFPIMFQTSNKTSVTLKPLPAGLFDRMSMDWFLDWPEEGLYDVGVKELQTCASVPGHLLGLLPQVLPSLSDLSQWKREPSDTSSCGQKHMRIGLIRRSMANRMCLCVRGFFFFLFLGKDGRVAESMQTVSGIAEPSSKMDQGDDTSTFGS